MPEGPFGGPRPFAVDDVVMIFEDITVIEAPIGLKQAEMRIQEIVDESRPSETSYPEVDLWLEWPLKEKWEETGSGGDDFVKPKKATKLSVDNDSKVAIVSIDNDSISMEKFDRIRELMQEAFGSTGGQIK